MNKMLLPTVEGAQISSTTRTVHQGRHVESYGKDLAKKMEKALELGQRLKWNQPQYREALERIIIKTRAELKNGEINLNKHTRESLGLPTGGQK